MQRLDENSDTNGKSFNIGSLFRSILLHSFSCFGVLVLKSLYIALDIFLMLMSSRSQEYGFTLLNAVEHYRGLQKRPRYYNCLPFKFIPRLFASLSSSFYVKARMRCHFVFCLTAWHFLVRVCCLISCRSV